MVASLVLITYLLYFNRLGTLLPGYNVTEVTTLKNAANWHQILTDPVSLPYRSIVWLLTAALHRSILMTRVVAACFGLVMALLFFAITRSWCGFRTAFLTTIMFATSAGLLHFARLGTGQVLQMGMLVLLAGALWYRRQRKHRILIAYVLVAACALLWYTPGMLWFELLGLLLLRQVIRSQLRRLRTQHLAAVIALTLLCLAPLLVAAVRAPRVLLQITGLPQALSSLSHFGSNLANIILAMFIHSNGRPLLWVGHAPLLDAAEVILGFIGAYYVYRAGSPRTTYLFGSLGIGIILVALGGSVSFACLVPALYIFIAIGIDHFLGRWLTVFPRNSFAQAAGISLVCVMIGFSVLYQVRTYFIAWPYAPATRAVFNKHQS